VSPTLAAKLGRLRGILRDTGGCAIACSGGVDSSPLLAAARKVLGGRCLAIIDTSSTHARREGAVAWVQEHDVPHVVTESEELDIPGLRDNPPDRCYHCMRRRGRAFHPVGSGGNLAPWSFGIGDVAG